MDENDANAVGDGTSEAEEQALLPISTEAPLMVGTPVVAIDGDVLGTVDNDTADRFKVAAPMAEDYWLPKQLIAGMAPGGDLIISVEKHTLDASKVAAPEEG
jgi:hypothetical protein